MINLIKAYSHINNYGIKRAHRIINNARSSFASRKGIKRIRESTLRSDLALLPSAGHKMVFRVDEKLNFAAVRDNSRNHVSNLLANIKDLLFWHFTENNNGRTQFNVLAADSRRVLLSLRERTEFSHWYFQEIYPNGKPSRIPRLLNSIDANKEYAGILIYERVAYDAVSNFRTGSREGASLVFWENSVSYPEHDDVPEGNGTPVIKSRVWNPRVIELPDPSVFTDEFNETLQSALAPQLVDVDFPIDVVYTWVNGNDAAWQARKAQALRIHRPEQFVAQAMSDARFADHDELKFSLRSLDQFAPWVRKIWIVTAGQTPDWLNDENPKIQIVDHQEIWPDESGLPNFNSHAIEANLHHIPGLADKFLYFNDDFILTRPVRPSAFYYGNGISKVFFSRALVNFQAISPLDNASTVAAKNARISLTGSGYKSFSRKYFHVPSALDKNILARAEKEFCTNFKKTRDAQFRQPTDLAAAGSFYFNYAMAIGEAVPAGIKYDYIDPAIPDGRKRMSRILRYRNKDCIVVNDGSSPEHPNQREETGRFIRQSLSQLLPVASQFEKTKESN